MSATSSSRWADGQGWRVRAPVLQESVQLGHRQCGCPNSTDSSSPACAPAQRNGLADSRFFFAQDAPCWLCRGSQTLGCPDCGGSGMKSRGGFVAD